MYNLRLRPAQRASLALTGPVVGSGAALISILVQADGALRVESVGEHRLLLGASSSGYVATFGAADIRIPFYKSAQGKVSVVGTGSTSIVSAAAAGLTTVIGVGAVIINVQATARDARIEGYGRINSFISAAGSGKINTQGVGSAGLRLTVTASGTAQPVGKGQAPVYLLAGASGKAGTSANGFVSIKLNALGRGYRGSIFHGAASVRIRGASVGAMGNKGYGDCRISFSANAVATTLPVFSGNGAVSIVLNSNGVGNHPKQIHEIETIFVRTRAHSLQVLL